MLRFIAILIHIFKFSNSFLFYKASKDYANIHQYENIIRKPEYHLQLASLRISYNTFHFKLNARSLLKDVDLSKRLITNIKNEIKKNEIVNNTNIEHNHDIIMKIKKSMKRVIKDDKIINSKNIEMKNFEYSGSDSQQQLLYDNKLIISVPSFVEMEDTTYNGQQLWDSIKHATLSDDGSFLILSNEIEYLDRDAIHKSIYIRNDYVELFDIMTELLSKPKSSIYYKKRFIIAGTPGIGKTTFIIYLLWRIISGNNNNDSNIWKNKQIFIQLSPSEILEFQGDRTILHTNMVLVGSKMKEHSILIVDTKQISEPVFSRGITLILSPLDRFRYDEYLKQSRYAKMLYMNVWKRTDIMKVWNYSYKSNSDDSLTEENVNNAFDKMGGIIRYVLEKNDEVDNKLTEALNKFKGKYRTLIDNAIRSSPFNDLETSHTLLHYCCTDKSHTNAILEYGSLFIIREILVGINKQDIKDAIKFINVDQCGDLQSYVGVVFEVIVHNYIMKLGLQNLKRLIPKNLTSKFNMTLDSYGVPLNDPSFNITGIINEIPIQFSLTNNNRNKIMIFCDNIYYRPTINNFVSTNSFLIQGNNIYIFQITVGEIHPVKESSVNILLNFLQTHFYNQKMKYHLVFICPKGRINTINFKYQKIQSSKDNIGISYSNINKLEKNIRPFIYNQWLAEFDFYDPEITNIWKDIKNH